MVNGNGLETELDRAILDRYSFELAFDQWDFKIKSGVQQTAVLTENCNHHDVALLYGGYSSKNEQQNNNEKSNNSWIHGVFFLDGSANNLNFLLYQKLTTTKKAITPKIFKKFYNINKLRNLTKKNRRVKMVCYKKIINPQNFGLAKNLQSNFHFSRMQNKLVQLDVRGNQEL